MESAPPSVETAKSRRGKPFVSGDPRIKAGPGRPPQSPAERERRRLARIAHDRVVGDVAGELRSMIGPALDKLRALIDNDDPAVALRAAADVISRVNGLPVSTAIVQATVSGADTTRKLTASEVSEAARMFLLRQGAAQAVEASASEGRP